MRGSEVIFHPGLGSAPPSSILIKVGHPSSSGKQAAAENALLGLPGQSTRISNPTTDIHPTPTQTSNPSSYFNLTVPSTNSLPSRSPPALQLEI